MSSALQRPDTPPGEHDVTELLTLSRSEAVELLDGARVGRLAVTLDGAHVPLIRPVTFVFDRPSQSLVFRTAAGSKLHAALRARMAAFEVDMLDEQTLTGWSVIVSGPIEQVTGDAELERLALTLPAPWAPGVKRHMLRVRATTVTGRRIVLSA